MAVPTIMPANSVSGYEVQNSVRFNDGDTPKISKTPDASNRKTWSFSTWIKRSFLGSNQRILGISNGSNDFRLRFNGDDKIEFLDGTISSEVITTNLFRDPAAWYHIVAVMDTTQGTAGNRAKLYVNGVHQLSIVDNSGTAGGAFASQNADGLINSNVLHTVGCRDRGDDGIDQSVDGYIAETHFIDGVAKLPTDFGKFDDNGVWIPIQYSGTYGTEGWFLQFKQTGTDADASGIGADTSGNGNHWAVTNLAAIDITTDTCTNNFCTFSPLQRTTGNVVLSEGNTLMTMGGDVNYSGQHGTIGVSKGKWYWEMKALDSSVVMIGALTLNTSPRGDNTSDSSGNGMYYYYANTHYQSNETTIRRSNAGNGSLGNSAVSGGNNAVDNLADDDIVQIALDMDNNKIYFGLNGTFVNSSNPANGTNSFTLHTDVSNPVSPYAGADGGQVSANFGQPSFAISSSNADANGHGNFEYAVPSGYFALCTKNLAEFG